MQGERFMSSSIELKKGAQYYVSNWGDDLKDGLSPSTAWKTLSKVSSMVFKPGDSILLRSGDVWNESVALKGSGTAEEPITFTAFGEGGNPVISYSNGDVVSIVNEGGWILRGLKIECTTEEPLIPYKFRNSAPGQGISGKEAFIGSINTNRGIKIEFNKEGKWSGILIDSNIISGCGIDRFSEGIVVFAAYPADKNDEVARNITISNNTVQDLGWRAIGSAGRDISVQGILPSSELFQNVKISGNVVTNIGVQGIVAGNCRHSLIERNIIDGAGLYSGEGVTWGPSGLWPICSSDVEIKFNEVCNMMHSNSGKDATGIDIDWRCVRVTVRNNYLHDNLGNGIVTMACHDSSITYNRVNGNHGKVNVGIGQIGLSDYTSDPHPVPVTGVENLEVLNNLIIIDRENTAAISTQHITPGDKWVGNSFRNNNIVFKEGVKDTYSHDIKENASIDIFEGNNYYGIKEGQIEAGFEGNSFFPLDSIKPSPVSGFEAEPDAENQSVLLSWIAATDEESGIHHYNIYRSRLPEFKPSYANMVDETSNTSLVDWYDIERDTTYYYLIEAEDRCGNVSTSVFASCTVP
jgi:hypothetical protein